MTMLDQSFTLMDAEEIDSATKDQVVATLALSASDSVRIGRLIDLIEHCARLGGIEYELDVPGYHRAFYGWEKKSSP